jgi:Rrf2 family protein
MRLELTRRGDYAVRAMLALARAGDPTQDDSEPDGRLSVARISDAEAIPPRILPSVMHQLMRAGLVSAQMGRTGGYRLAHRAELISLLDIIEAVEGGDTRPPVCIVRGGPCLANGRCSVHVPIFAAREALRSSLAGATLESVLTAPAGRTARRPTPGRGT